MRVATLKSAPWTSRPQGCWAGWHVQRCRSSDKHPTTLVISRLQQKVKPIPAAWSFCPLLNRWDLSNITQCKNMQNAAQHVHPRHWWSFPHGTNGTDLVLWPGMDGFRSAADCCKTDSFLCHCKLTGYYKPDIPTITGLFNDANAKPLHENEITSCAPIFFSQLSLYGCNLWPGNM